MPRPRSPRPPIGPDGAVGPDGPGDPGGPGGPAGPRAPLPPLTGRVTALAHRGASPSGEAGENTLAAFASAAELGYRWVESDVHASADGELLLLHDPDLERTTGVRALVADLPWARLREVRTEDGSPLLRLEELLDALPQLRVNLDVKAPGAVAPLVELLVRRPELVDRLRVASFSERRRAGVLRGLRRRGVRPGPRSSAAATGVRLVWLLSRAPLPVAVRGALARGLRVVLGADSLQVPEVSGRLRVVTPALVETAHAGGWEVHVWTVDDPADAHRLLDLGVDGLVTDAAAAIRAVLEERGAWHPSPDDGPTGGPTDGPTDGGAGAGRGGAS